MYSGLARHIAIGVEHGIPSNIPAYRKNRTRFDQQNERPRSLETPKTINHVDSSARTSIGLNRGAISVLEIVLFRRGVGPVPFDFLHNTLTTSRVRDAGDNLQAHCQTDPLCLESMQQTLARALRSLRGLLKYAGGLKFDEQAYL